MARLSMTIEPVAPFNGLDVLVARDEGLFEQEGLDLRFAFAPPGERPMTETGSTARPNTLQGRFVERGEAMMFQA